VAQDKGKISITANGELPSGFVHYYQSSDFKFFYIISFNQQDLSQISQG
jgi:hypothetical protein